MDKEQTESHRGGVIQVDMGMKGRLQRGSGECLNWDLKIEFRDIPGSPVVKESAFQCRGHKL